MAMAAVALAWTGSTALAAGFEEAVVQGSVASDGGEAMDASPADAPWITSDGFLSGDDASGMPECQDCPHGADWRHGDRCDACEPPYGMVNRLIDNKHACWTFRTEALLLWREAPRYRPLGEVIPAGIPLPNANQLNSTPAAGPRFSLFRTNGCGDALEITYFRAANWRATNVAANGPPGVATETFASNLGAAAQSFELNGRMTVLPSIQLLGGFRWFEWQESFSAIDTITSPTVDTVQLGVGTINDLYGYQIGFDSLLLNTNWLRVEALMKGGAYYNVARMSAAATTPFGPYNATVGGDAASFVGEVGVTGVMPVTRSIDFRFGYLALWLQGLAQPTNQYRTSSPDPAVPAVIDLTGSTVLQGLTLGLEGRW